MQPTAAEIEKIIQAVLAQFVVDRAAPIVTAPVVLPISSSVSAQKPVIDTSELVLKDRVITVATLENQLAGIKTLRVRSRAVVTPAAVDLLRARTVKLQRDASSSNSSSSNTNSANTNSASAAPVAPLLAPVLVCGAAPWFQSLSRHLCPKQALVAGGDSAAAVGLIEQHFAAAHAATSRPKALWISPAPFAAAVALQGRVARPVAHVPSMLELAAALSQAKPDVIVVDAGRWTVAAIGNLVRQWLRSH